MPKTCGGEGRNGGVTAEVVKLGEWGQEEVKG